LTVRSRISRRGVRHGKSAGKTPLASSLSVPPATSTSAAAAGYTTPSSKSI